MASEDAVSPRVGRIVESQGARYWVEDMDIVVSRLLDQSTIFFIDFARPADPTVELRHIMLDHFTDYIVPPHVFKVTGITCA